jgi:thymidine phosphorylase
VVQAVPTAHQALTVRPGQWTSIILPQEGTVLTEAMGPMVETEEMVEMLHRRWFE